MSSLSRRYRLAQPDVGGFMPPSLPSIGAMPFNAPQRARLSAWLRESAWPREHMGIAELEGYVVALIGWPVDIPSGAWLPPIWGERGWKVPKKIASRLMYEEFVALIVGFMQSLDRDLSGHHLTRFESSVLRGLRGREHAEALHAWGRGFMTALTLGSQGLKWRSVTARAAVRTIASSTSASAPIRPGAIEDIASAVTSLMEQRASRGPLGPLDAVVRPESAAGGA